MKRRPSLIVAALMLPPRRPPFGPWGAGHSGWSRRGGRRRRQTDAGIEIMPPGCGRIGEPRRAGVTPRSIFRIRRLGRRRGFPSAELDDGSVPTSTGRRPAAGERCARPGRSISVTLDLGSAGNLRSTRSSDLTVPAERSAVAEMLAEAGPVPSPPEPGCCRRNAPRRRRKRPSSHRLDRCGQRTFVEGRATGGPTPGVSGSRRRRLRDSAASARDADPGAASA
jgi:hypothetical protein